jgi:hypothetical protein
MSVTRYIVTHVNTDGERVMSAPARQGRFTYATPEGAEEQMVAMLTNPTNDIAGVFGKQAVGTFAVRPIECWPIHFDPKSIFIEGWRTARPTFPE